MKLDPVDGLPGMQGRVMSLSCVYVDPAERGQGKGRAQVIRACAQADLSGQILIAHLEDIALAEFYEPHGFGVMQTEPCILIARKPQQPQIQH